MYAITGILQKPYLERVLIKSESTEELFEAAIDMRKELLAGHLIDKEKNIPYDHIAIVDDQLNRLWSSKGMDRYNENHGHMQEGTVIRLNLTGMRMQIVKMNAEQYLDNMYLKRKVREVPESVVLKEMGRNKGFHNMKLDQLEHNDVTILGIEPVPERLFKRSYFFACDSRAKETIREFGEIQENSKILRDAENLPIVTELVSEMLDNKEYDLIYEIADDFKIAFPIDGQGERNESRYKFISEEIQEQLNHAVCKYEEKDMDVVYYFNGAEYEKKKGKYVFEALLNENGLPQITKEYTGIENPQKKSSVYRLSSDCKIADLIKNTSTCYNDHMFSPEYSFLSRNLQMKFKKAIEIEKQKAQEIDSELDER